VGNLLIGGSKKLSMLMPIKRGSENLFKGIYLNLKIKMRTYLKNHSSRKLFCLLSIIANQSSTNIIRMIKWLAPYQNKHTLTS